MKKQIREIRIEGNIAYVPLTGGYEAMIDADDAPLVDGFNWSHKIVLKPSGAIRTVYARRTDRSNGGKKHIPMHRVIACTPHHLQTDHIDGNGLNNTRNNLRHATISQNQANMRLRDDNTSGQKGVHWHKPSGKWRAAIRHCNSFYHIGLYDTLDDAASAYLRKSDELNGRFSNTKTTHEKTLPTDQG